MGNHVSLIYRRLHREDGYMGLGAAHPFPDRSLSAFGTVMAYTLPPLSQILLIYIHLRIFFFLLRHMRRILAHSRSYLDIIGSQPFAPLLRAPKALVELHAFFERS